MSIFDAQRAVLDDVPAQEITGTVAAVRGLRVLVDDLPLPIGALVKVKSAGARHMPPLRGEVVGFDGSRSIIMLYSELHGIAPGARVIGERWRQSVMVGEALLGCVLNALGEPLDGGVLPSDLTPRTIHPQPTDALRRTPIDAPLPTGVRAVDGFLTLGQGQRVGVFAGPGVGKSTLLASIARNTAADMSVIALVGERGREVREFLERTLGEQGRKRSVVICATGDESPLLRVRAAHVACTVAEHFRAQGANVLLIMDSVTRFAQAQRQIGLTVGEQPATRGYTPSVFAALPVLLERAGGIEGGGSITGIYAVLVEGDDIDEPVSDAVRGILDGHIALSRKLATRGHFPAIDVTGSISRVADAVSDPNHIAARRQLLRMLAAYQDVEELFTIGAYARGSNLLGDAAIALKPDLDRFLQQNTGERAEYPHTCKQLLDLAVHSERLLAQVQSNAQHGAAAAQMQAQGRGKR